MRHDVPRSTTVPPAPPELRVVITRALDGADLGVVVGGTAAAALAAAAVGSAGGDGRGGDGRDADAAGAAAVSALLLPDAHDALGVLVLRALSVEHVVGLRGAPVLCLRLPPPLRRIRLRTPRGGSMHILIWRTCTLAAQPSPMNSRTR